MKFKTALLAGVAAIALPFAASAQSAPERGFYIGAGAGIQHKDDTRGNTNRQPGQSFSRYDDIGWGLNLSGGYDFGNGPRIELQGLYLNTKVKSSGGAAAPLNGVPPADSARASGDAEVYAGLVNFLYDFDLGLPIKPYLGGGIGYAYSDISGSTDWGFAYQGIAGISYDVMPQLKITLDYHYVATEGVSHGVNYANGNTGAPRGSGSYNDQSVHHVGMLGVRWTFAEPVMAAAVTPPPPPPVVSRQQDQVVQRPGDVRNYIVFFDFDKSNLTNEARSQVRNAADSAKSQQVTRIELTGHTDRSGSPQYNLALSQRRADAVKAELVRLGVPSGGIVTYAKGESSPLVPTPDGVKEPQNRRVEIVLNR